MNDNYTDENIEAALKAFFRQSRYYDADKLYNDILIKEKEFMDHLNVDQRIEFVKIRAMYDRYVDLKQHDSLSIGFFEGLKCSDEKFN